MEVNAPGAHNTIYCCRIGIIAPGIVCLRRVQRISRIKLHRERSLVVVNVAEQELDQL